MKAELLGNVERSFVSYMKKRLDGRSLRLKKKWDKVSETESLVLNEPCYTEDDSTDRIDQVAKQGDLPLDEHVTNKLVIQNAMKHLTKKEFFVIKKLFWEQKRVKELCVEMDVSKTAVLKTKRNALGKMKRVIVL